MKKWLIIIIIFLGTNTYAQRWYAVNDSTSYSYDNINIIVGKNKVYLNHDNTLTLIRDFSDVIAQNQFIRDFDFIDAETWYVLIGLRTISSPTKLYRTIDSGLNWELIEPESFTVPNNIDGKAQSINQVQVLNGRIYLFDTYYISRVFYSDDQGQTWVHWFEGFWSHYYQIYACGPDLYLHGLSGDGFPAYMFKIPQMYMTMQNVLETTISECVNSTGENCYYAPPNISVPAVYDYFKNLFETSICTSLEVDDVALIEVAAHPNPVTNFLTLSRIDTSVPFKITVFNNLGQLCLEENNNAMINFSPLASGLYLVKVTRGSDTTTIKVFKN